MAVSVAAEAVAFLGAEGLITTSAVAVIGVRLLGRASVTTARAGTGGRKSTTTTTAAVTETAAKPPLAPVEDAPEAGAA